MAQIFISYKNSEREEVRKIAAGLEAEGFSVWWDFSLRAGQDYSQVIDNEIAAAKVVVTIWSRESIKSRWVSAEAERGWDKLFPVLLDDVSPPLPYNKLHTLDLIKWNGDRGDARWRRMVADLQAIMAGAAFAPVQTLTLQAARSGSKAKRLASITAWAASAIAVVALGLVTMQNLPALRALVSGERSDAAAHSDGEAAAQAPAQSREANSVGEPPLAAATRTQPDRGVRPIRTYDETVSAIRATGSDVSLEICSRSDGARCGLTRVRIGEVITVRIVSQLSGRLILLDQDSTGAQLQIFPNGLSRSGSALLVHAGQSIELPLEGQGFVFGVSEPAGPSKLIAMVVPETAPLPVIVAENVRERGIQAVPASRRDEFAAVAAGLTQSNEMQRAAIGELDYQVVR